MKQIETYRGKKVLVLGLAKSGYGVTKLLLKLGATVIVNDKNDLSGDEHALELEKLGVKIISGSHPVELLDESFDYMVKNPGIPYSNPMVERAQELELPILTEPEVAAEVSEAPIVAITGSNGKTTTTMLTAEMLNKHLTKGRAYTVGNIGRPISELVEDVTKNDILVLEISSFQLLGTFKFHPKIAAIVDIYPTHIDYHGNLENYVAAKLRITQNQTAADYFIANFDQKDILAKELATTKAQVKNVSLTDPTADYYVSTDNLVGNGTDLLAIDQVKLPGRHNLQNALVASAIAQIFGVTKSEIAAVLTSFRGVRHRIQYVTEFNGREFYNDSKATNIEAATVAITSFNKPEVLIAGGLDRGFTFEDLIEPLQKHVKSVVLYGESKQLLADAAKAAGIADIAIVDTLEEAVPKAYEQSAVGDIILLSPACASWDQFKTFEERGDKYINYVEQLIERTK